ncbi:Wzz/FepE/Etk N-terminal domain-containing protein [Bradyrhizobium sacchari]|uniref:Subunit length determinant protein n=1 Tax=Bradyrhizobium sacchari TaxID=1399419 RepID=A0A560KN33_9BRAD|nr:Wzz/FepE/Etk N-terminal domain-containing protein [Bradyrhizobium sacchari]TWB67350.1 subunit length determinant protein [Bradyrhizobium sacchari]TWB84587.1 subunit length determinant protein [Bradyrhizobium sacchari]
MVQTNRTDNWVNRDNMPPDFRPAPTMSLVEVLAFIRRHLSIISLATLATLVIAIIYLITATPTYTAKAELVVDSRAVDPTSVSTIVESQIKIITSESIANAVIEKLGLAQDPEFEASQASPLHSMTSSISRLLGWSKPETKAHAARYIVESFQRKLLAKRLGPTYLVEITFDSRDPDRAAQILNAVAEKYITRQMDYAGLRDDSWIKDRLNELSTQALAAQKALEDFSRNRKDTADSAATIDRLAAAAESSKSAYDNFRHVLRKMEATRQQSLPVFEASLITGASPPLRASSPKARVVLGAAIVAGALLGIAIGILRELSEILAIGQEPRRSAQDDWIERPIPDVLRSDHQSEISAKTRPARLTGSG